MCLVAKNKLVCLIREFFSGIEIKLLGSSTLHFLWGMFFIMWSHY